MAHGLQTLPGTVDFRLDSWGDDLLTRNRQNLLIAACAVATLTGSPALADDAARNANNGALTQFKEVSYLVFHRSAGFDRPEIMADVLDGTVTMRFRRMPANWQNILAPQVQSARKRRFFRTMQPIVEGGKLVGLKVRIGVGAFGVRGYVKNRPRRWVLRIGELRRPPFGRGRTGVPVVPYADLIEEEAEGRSRFVSAELGFARGEFKVPCLAFHELRADGGELASWAALREADCLLEVGEHAAARDILGDVVKAGHTPGAMILARIRIAEADGTVLSKRFERALFTAARDIGSFVGTVADEIAYREARAMLFRGQAHEAFRVLERLHRDRPRSAFFADRQLLHTLRWRAVRDSAQEGRWLECARAYLEIPPTQPDVPNWTAIHGYGAEALREIGLPKRASQVYLHIMRKPGAVIDEVATILNLAETYREAGDDYRARITIRYLIERFPKMASDRRVVRLRGRLAMARGNAPATGEATDMMAKLLGRGGRSAPRADATDTRFVVEGAISALKSEGLVAARRPLTRMTGKYRAQGLPFEVSRDLAFAARDCDALSRMAAPLELADGQTLLWAGVCLMGEHRMGEASVLFEAARVYASAELAAPAMDPVLQMVRESADWWTRNQARLASGGKPGSKSATRAGQRPDPSI